MKKIVVQVASCAKATSDITTGVMRYAAEHHDWEVQLRGLHPSNDRLMDFASWQPDGIIAAERIRDDDPIFRVRTLRAAAFLFREPPRTFRGRCVQVTADNAQIGRLAAEFFLRRGLANFAYVGSLDDEAWSRERGDGFRRTLAKAGRRAATYVSPSRSGKWEDEREGLLAFLKRQSRPCGVFAAFDQRAKHILDVCREEGIAIPEQVLVVGMDNESWICDNTKPTLTSIDADFRLGGYLAAEQLDGILDGHAPGAGILRFPPRGIVERGSTADLNCRARSVALAREFIRIHAIEPVSVGDVAHAAGTTLRVLQKNFREVAGVGIAAEIRRRRLEHACELLTGTDMPLAQVTRFCSLGTEANAKTLFRRQFGMTMTEWRNRRISTREERP